MPLRGTLDVCIPDEQLVSLTEPASPAADQYRALRHSVESLRAGADLRVVCVTSPTPGDGKTVTTLNLAGALAQAPGARVLVVDADLRRPSVARYLAIDDGRAPGLSSLLRDPSAALADGIRHLSSVNLSVLPAGPATSSPYELLDSPRLPALLRDARREFDWVLVDTPPCVSLPDCRLIARSVDGFLMIVAAHKTPRRMVEEGIAQIDAAKMLGVVFNGDDRRSRRYDAYYGYYGQPARARAFQGWRRFFGP